MTVMSKDFRAAKARVNRLFKSYSAAPSSPSVVPSGVSEAKMYEVYILAHVLERLRLDEGYDRITLVGSTMVHLRASGGPIDFRYPHFALKDSAGLLRPLQVWTDIEFSTMSNATRPPHLLPPLRRQPHRAHLHELDVVVVPPGPERYPDSTEIRIGVECKHTAFAKNFSREALGVRRELSLLRGATPTGFVRWPAADVPASPPSVLMVCSTSPKVLEYLAAGKYFGILYEHHRV